MKILISGHTGQVARELQLALSKHELVSLGRQAFDLSRPDSLRETILRERPALVINAAAYTAVDKAETEGHAAQAANATTPGAIARWCALHNVPLVHYSTDYVFAGDKSTAYVEDDPTGPLNVYGQTKLEGEQAIRASGCPHLILRTSWVYAARGGNFAKTMLRLAADRAELRVVADQVGAPTSAELIADVTALVLQRIATDAALGKTASGTYHLVASGATSWHGYAQFVIGEAARLGIALRATPESIHPITAAEYPVPAQRPANSRLDNHKLQQTFGLELPTWEFHVKRMLIELNN